MAFCYLKVERTTIKSQSIQRRMKRNGGAVMNEQEAKKILDGIEEVSGNLPEDGDEVEEALIMAKEALNEIQQYRALGTVKELKAMMDNGAFTGIELAQLAAMQMKLKEYQQLGTVDEMKQFMNEIHRLLENQKLLVTYQKIGTAEELQEAKGKQMDYKPKKYEDKYYACKCGNVLMHKWKKYNTELMPKSECLPYCLNCGQKLDWSD